MLVSRIRCLILNASFLSLLIFSGCAGGRTQQNVNDSKTTENDPVHSVIVQPGDSIQSAINSLPATGGVVYLLRGTYSGRFANTKANVALIGAGPAQINATHTQFNRGTGTIIEGEFTSTASGTSLSHLSIDCGPVVQSTGTNCLVMENAGGETISADVVSDVAILGYSPSAPYHALYSGNVNGMVLDHVTEYNNFHGFALYDYNVEIRDVEGWSNNGECLFLGSDTTSANGAGGAVNGTGITCQSFAAGDLGSGVILTAKGAMLQDVSLNKIQILGNANGGITLNTSGPTYTIRGVNISDFILDGQGSAGGGTNPPSQIGIYVQEVGGALMQQLHFARGHIRNQYFAPIFMGQDTTQTSFFDIDGENFNGPADIRGSAARFDTLTFLNIATGSECFDVIGGSVYYQRLACTGPSMLIGGAGTYVPLIPSAPPPPQSGQSEMP